jgi:diguanylate cyclase (GGDEF)-like protein
VLYAVLVGLTYYAGGLSSPLASWLTTPPIFAILLLGRRHAVGWTALGVLTVVAFRVAEVSGMRFPVGYPPEWTTRITLGSHAGLVVCTAILLFVFEDIRAAAQGRAEAASRALARLAYHDTLTGLANRARFLECLDAALATALAAGDPARVAVLVLDLDGFKGVNDSMGHAAGDALLAQVAARLLNATRGCDTVARMGGDEFAVLLDGVPQDAAASVVAQRIVTAVAAPFEIHGREARIGASLGIARAAAPADAPSAVAEVLGTAEVTDAPRAPQGVAAAVLHHADVAMYQAKALGRGRWAWYEADLPTLPTQAPAPAGDRRCELGQPCLGMA